MSSFVSKEWKDIQCQYPNRYKAVKEDSSEENLTMFNNFGLITESGDVFDAATMNNLEDRIDTGFDGVMESLSGTTIPSGSLGKDGDLYFQYKVENNVTSIIGMFVKINSEWLMVPLYVEPES